MTDWAQLSEALRERGFEIAHNVRVSGFGDRKIAVIKTVRELTGWGLAVTKNAVESRATILHSITPEAAERVARTLQRAGATVEIGVDELRIYAFDPDHPLRGDQPLERLRVLGLGLAHEQGTLGAWTREPVTPLDADLLLAAIDERRHGWAAAGKREAASELAVLEAVSARDRALEDRLRNSDGEVRAREAAVYGDWLQAQGDPRGMIAAAAFSVGEAGEAAGLREQRQLELDRLVLDNRSHLFGPARRLADVTRWTWLGPVLDTLATEPPNPPESVQRLLTCDELEVLLATPICACLRVLALEGLIDRDDALGEVLAAAACAGSLRELRIHDAVAVTIDGDAFTGLQELALAGEFTLARAKLPALRKLELDVEDPFGRGVANFVELDTPKLEHVTITIPTYEDWDGEDVPPDYELFELLSQPGFAKVRTLTIAGGSLRAGFADLLARIPAIATLERIDLREATMSEACRAELERSRDRLPGLLLDR